MNRPRIRTGLFLSTCLLGAVSSPALAGWSPPDVVVEYPAGRFGPGYATLLLDPTAGIISVFQEFPGYATRTGRVAFDGTAFLNWGYPFGGWWGTKYDAVLDGAGGVFWVAWDNSDVYLFRTPLEGGQDPTFYYFPIAADPDTNETAGHLVSDGAGGVLVAYVKLGGGLFGDGPIVKHVLPDGTYDPAWPAGGVHLRPPHEWSSEDELAVLPDGANGMYAMWLNSNSTASGALITRITSSGTLAPGWTFPGIYLADYYSHAYRLLSGDAQHILAFWWDENLNKLRLGRVHVNGYVDGTPLILPAPESGLQIHSDLHGGAFVTWKGGVDVRAMHYLPDGTPAPGWPAGGASLLAGTSGPSGYVLAPHEDGRLTIGWSEPLDIYSFAYRARLRWILPDGTIDPDQPDSGLALGGAPNTGPLAIIRNGSGGVYVLRSERIPDYLEPAKLWLSQVEQQHNVDVPRPASGGALVLSAVQPNPATGPATVRFRLPGDVPARMEVVDVTGRLIDTRTVSGAGDHVERLDRVGAWPPGVYCVRVSQNGIGRSTRFVIVR